ncbi:MAG: PQQ-like beta-propeller repeat protein, partial [Planctomycetes bacterium]|nr:PQQ-like beta-propeller repeat protein [Planctomycetota bacterium]
MASNYPTHEIDAAGGAKPARPRRIHWKTAVIIVQCGALVGLIWWNWFAADRTYKVMSLYYVVPGTALALVAWWVLFSGFARKTRAIGVGVLLAAAGLFVLLVRVEGFGGDFLPQLAWRFAATAEQRAQEFWRARRSSADLRSAPHGNGTNAEAAAKRVAEAADASEPSSELPIAADDWPRFRGPLGDGIVRGVTLEADWDARPPEEAWRIPIGPGWSSFAVVGDLAFTQEQRGPDECIVCYDLETGSELWVHADAGRFSSTVAGDGPRATPTIADSRLYALGALGRLNCLDPFTGRVLWTTNILEDAGVQNLIWGMAGSPLVLGDLVIVNPGGNAATGANAGVAAYDRKTGRRVWADGDRPASYCAPRLEVLGDLRQVLVLDGVGLHGYAPA